MNTDNALVVKLADIKDLRPGCPSKLYVILNFIFRPKRILRLFTNIINKKDESKLENAVLQMMNRFKRSNKPH